MLLLFTFFVYICQGLDPSQRASRKIHLLQPFSTVNAPSAAPFAALGSSADSQHNCDHFLLHFTAQTVTFAKETLEKRFLRDVDFIPANTLQIFACESELQGWSLPGLLWYNRLDSDQKKDPSVHPKFLPLEDDHITLTVFTCGDDTLPMRWSSSPKLAAVKEINKITKQKYRLTVVASDVHQVVAVLAQQTEVKYVHRAPKFYPQNNYATSLLQSDTYGLRPVWARNITGMGQICHIGDTGLDIDSCYFRDGEVQVEFYPSISTKHRKILTYIESVNQFGQRDHTDPPQAHGTHVTGSVAGNSQDPATMPWNGMAHDAKIVFTDLSASQGLLLPPDFDLYWRPPLDLGARISSNSWGTDDVTRSYIDTDRETDIFAYNNQDFLIVVAVGNTGARGILSPGSSKNALSVGASMNSADDGYNGRQYMPFFSGVGPTYDGRIKPEVVAPGAPITSAQSDGQDNRDQCDVEPKAGTSMAAPLAAGAAVLARQYFQDGWYPTGRHVEADGFTPSAALLKAMIIHSARPMNGRAGYEVLTDNVPNKVQGWGLMQVDRVLYFDNSSFKLYVVNNITLVHRQRWTWCFTASSGLPLRATLVWMDAVVAMGSNLSVANDLDLQMDNGSMAWRANGYSTDAWEADNVVEQIHIKEPAAGYYRVSVYGQHLPLTFEAGQPLSLVVTGAGLAPSENCPSGCGRCQYGTCIDSFCQCNFGFHHVDCSLCDEDLLCNGHGQCDPHNLGKCTCDNHFQGQHCTECQPGWYGSNCDSDCKCNHGECDHTTGVCSCYNDTAHGHWGGTKCDQCSFDWTGNNCKDVSHWCQNHATVTLTGGSGIIQVTGNPKYISNMKCTWKIYAEGCDTMQLTFDWIDTEEGFDPIYIFNSEEEDLPMALGRLWGSDSKPHVFRSQVNGLLHVVFESDITSVKKGFIARYQCATGGMSEDATPSTEVRVGTSLAMDDDDLRLHDRIMFGDAIQDVLQGQSGATKFVNMSQLNSTGPQVAGPLVISGQDPSVIFNSTILPEGLGDNALPNALLHSGHVLHTELEEPTLWPSLAILVAISTLAFVIAASIPLVVCWLRKARCSRIHSSFVPMEEHLPMDPVDPSTVHELLPSRQITDAPSPVDNPDAEH